MLRHLTDIAHLHKQLPEFFNLQWLRINFVHSAKYSFLDILILDVPGDRHNLRLLLPLDVSREVHFSDLFCRVIPIKEWHIAIHKDEAEFVWIIGVESLLHLVDSLLAVVGELGHGCALFEA